eukprot:COSAG06_NODE_45175_length_357_cov_0.600775_1_plen_61_part_10
MPRRHGKTECHTETTQGRTRFGTRVGSKLPWVAMGILLDLRVGGAAAAAVEVRRTDEEVLR